MIREFRERKTSRQEQTIGERLLADLDVLRALPPAPLEACETKTVRVTTTSLVRYRCNDYSVPTTHGLSCVTVKGFVDEVVIFAGEEEIARHPRSYEWHTFIYDPLHYLALLEQKPGAPAHHRCASFVSGGL